MKRLTLDETWRECLRMWKFIAKERRKNRTIHPGTLKAKWFKRYYKGRRRPSHLCFFCGYDDHYGSRQCSSCPARLVDSNFGKYGCEVFSCYYNWQMRPIAFYNKLVSLNRKRLKGKK